MKSSELFSEIEFRESDKSYPCKLCDQTLRYCNSLRRVVEVEHDNPNKISSYGHACRKLLGRKPINMFEQQLDPLELYQRQQFVFADQRRKDAEREEQRKIEAGRQYLADRKKENADRKEKLELKLAKKRIAELEQENARLRQQEQ